MSIALHSTSKSKLHRISALFLAAALVLCCMAGILPASAEETTGSMTLRCVKDEDVVVNMHWQLYRVGHRADSHTFHTKAFRCSVAGNQRIDRAVNANESQICFLANHRVHLLERCLYSFQYIVTDRTVKYK